MVMGIDGLVIGRSRVRSPAGALPGSLWQLSLGLRRGAFTCVGWQVTLCNPAWQMTPSISRTTSRQGLYSALTLTLAMKRDKPQAATQLLGQARRSLKLLPFRIISIIDNILLYYLGPVLITSFTWRPAIDHQWRDIKLIT